MMTSSTARRLSGIAALTIGCLGMATPALAAGTGSVAGTATFTGASCTANGKQVTVSIRDGSAQGGATYTLVANSGAVTPNRTTVFDGSYWLNPVAVTANATALYVYADGQLIGQTSLPNCSGTHSSSSSSAVASASTQSRSSSATTTTTSRAKTLPTSTSTAVAVPTQSTQTATPTFSSTHTAATTSATASATSPQKTTSTTPSTKTAPVSTSTTPATQVAPGPAPATSVQAAPKTNPQGSAGPLKWGAAIALVLGGVALAAIYFRREFKR